MFALRFIIGLFLLFNLAGCQCHGFTQVKTSEGMLACPKCCPMIKYSGTSISVKGVNLGIPKTPVIIGEVSFEPKIIQTACDTVQILENHRIFTCQMLPSYATVSRASFAQALEAMQKDETVLTQFALIVASKDGAAIQKFVDYYGPQAKRIKVSEETSKAETFSVKSVAYVEPSKGLTTLSLN